MIRGEFRAEKRIRRLFLWVSCLFFLPALGAGGQAELATFRGKVVDAEGNPVADATIVLLDATRGGAIKIKTNDKGNFYRRGLRPSEYVLTIEKDGVSNFTNL